MAMMELTERQRRTVAAAITTLSGLFMAAVLIAFVVLGLRLVAAFSVVVLPLAVAGVVALVTRPYFDLLVRFSRSAALALLLYFGSILVVLGTLGWFFGGLLISQVSSLIANLPVWIEGAIEALKARLPAVGNLVDVDTVLAQAQTVLTRNDKAVMAALHGATVGLLAAGSSVFQWLAGLLGWLICPVYLAFLLRMPQPKPGTLEALLPFLKPDTRRDVVYLVREFSQIIIRFFRGQATVAAIQGVMYATAFSLVQVPYGFAIGALMGVLNIVPFLGTTVGLTLAILLSLVDPAGGLGRCLWALGAFGTVQVIESYFITPRIMGKRTGLHPLAIIVAMFFWGTALGGLLGVLLAVPLTAFIVVLWRLLKTKYIREIV